MRAREGLSIPSTCFLFMDLFSLTLNWWQVVSHKENPSLSSKRWGKWFVCLNFGVPQHWDSLALWAPTLPDTTARLLPAAQEVPLQKAKWCWLLCLISRIQATRRAKNIPINHSFSTQVLMTVPQRYYTTAIRKMWSANLTKKNEKLEKKYFKQKSNRKQLARTVSSEFKHGLHHQKCREACATCNCGSWLWGACKLSGVTHTGYIISVLHWLYTERSFWL